MDEAAELSGEMFTTDFMAANMTCVSRKKTAFLLFAIIPTIPIIVNVIVLVAVALDSRRLLRQNRVYAHVSSTLIANVIFSILTLLQILSLYFNFEGYYDDPDPGRQGAVKQDLAEWWAFRKASLYGMFIIMCGNIGFLIEAIRSGICIALRSAAGAVRTRTKRSTTKSRTSSRQLSGRTHDTAVPSSRVAKRRRSYISIALLWIISMVYVIIPTAGWSCSHACTCLSSCFPEGQIQNPPVSGCSRALPPMTNSWLAVTIAVWAVCLLAVLILLRRSVVVLKKAVARHKPEELDSALPHVTACFEPSKESIELNDEEKQETENFPQKDFREIHSPNAETKTDHSEEPNGRKNKQPVVSRTKSTTSSGFAFSGIFGSRKSQRRANLSNSLNVDSSFKHVTWLTILFACSTAPPMGYMAADMAFPSMKMNMILMNVCLLFPFTYCIICPFLLVKCLPGVKLSIEHLFLKGCTTTKFVRRSLPSQEIDSM